MERLEPRVLACAWAPQAPLDVHAAATAAAPIASALDAPAAVEPAGAADYNSPFLTDAQLEDFAAMSAAEIRAFLVSQNSYFKQTIPDVDDVLFDPATVIAQAAAQYRINPEV